MEITGESGYYITGELVCERERERERERQGRGGGNCRRSPVKVKLFFSVHCRDFEGKNPLRKTYRQISLKISSFVKRHSSSSSTFFFLL